MKINISSLPDGVREYTLSKGCAELGLDQHFAGDVTARVRLEKTGRQIFLDVSLVSRANFSCDRCLEDFARDIFGSYRAVYVRNEQEYDGGEDEEVHSLSPDANLIDISADVRDYLLIAVPLKLLCKEECAGLCANCGRNLNLMPDKVCRCGDRRSNSQWSKLGDLYGKLGTEN